MKTEKKNTLSITVSGTLTISRSDLESLLREIMAQLRDGVPGVGVGPKKRTAKDFEPPGFWCRYDTVCRLVRRGLLSSSTALRHRKIPKCEIEVKETTK
jgi:hypothetical protein